jgi:PPOX class probable F420-dependent enzyme
MPSDPVLTTIQRTFLDAARRATLATIAPEGVPRLVPICFVVHPELPLVYSPIDEKPKRSADPVALARVRDLLVDPHVEILVDRWDEDWTRLAWLRGSGTATLIESGHEEHLPAIAGLRARYAQYVDHDLEHRPVIRIAIERVTAWGALDDPG